MLRERVGEPLVDDPEEFRRSVVGQVIVDVRFRTEGGSPGQPGYREEILLVLESGYVIQFSSSFSPDYLRSREGATGGLGTGSRARHARSEETVN